MRTAGIDIGSYGKSGHCGRRKNSRNKNYLYRVQCGSCGEKVYKDLLAEIGLDASAVSKIVFHRLRPQFSEVRPQVFYGNHGACRRRIFPKSKIRTIIDIGGQDSKAMALDEKGKVQNFVMNDKCAAGTGRFLEVMARALEVNLDGSVQCRCNQRCLQRSAVCAQSLRNPEVISLIARGEKAGHHCGHP